MMERKIEIDCSQGRRIRLIGDWSRPHAASSNELARVLRGETAVVIDLTECTGLSWEMAHPIAWACRESEGERWRRFVGLWWREFGPRLVTSQELFDLAATAQLFDMGDLEGHGAKVSFGRRLRAQEGRTVGDVQIVSKGKQARAVRWMLRDLWESGEQAGCSLRLVGVTPEMEQVLKMHGLAKWLEA